MREPLRVLLVEDNEDDALLLVEELRAGGFAPQYARVQTEQELRESLAQNSWELVLADYTLPNFSGVGALRTIRQSGQDIPFIIVSGTVSEQQAIDMMREGAHDFILKQSLARLVPAVRRELGEAAGRRERRRVEEALREQEAQLRLITDNSPDAIITIDEACNIRFANPASETIFGYAIAEMEGQPITMLVPERFREAYLAAMQEYLTPGKRPVPSWSGVESIGLHRSGREFALEVSYGEFLRGNDRFIIGVMRDIERSETGGSGLTRRAGIPTDHHR